MTRKQKATSPTGSRQSAAVHSQTSVATKPDSGERASLLLAWLMALLVARWLIPTEASAQGMTLWIVQLVLLTAVGRIAWLWRTGQSLAQFDRIDGAIGLLIGAQVVSALTVVCTIGNQRGAINMAWEWIGSGVLIWLIRQELKSARIVREVCLGLTLTGAILVETVFAWPGLGRLMLDSIETRDYPVLMGLFLLVTVGVVVANLITDISYSVLDPRIGDSGAD